MIEHSPRIIASEGKATIYYQVPSAESTQQSPVLALCLKFCLFFWYLLHCQFTHFPFFSPLSQSFFRCKMACFNQPRFVCQLVSNLIVLTIRKCIIESINSCHLLLHSNCFTYLLHQLVEVYASVCSAG